MTIAEALIVAALDRAAPGEAELAGAGIDRVTWCWLVERLARCGADLLADAAGEGRRWTEVGVGTGDVGNAMSAWLRSDGPERIGSMVRDGSLEHFFFVYKPPGLRFRFRTRSASISSAVSLAALRAGFDRCSLQVGVYEPETPLLGTGAGLCATHSFFTVDSLAVIDYQRNWLCERASNADPPWLRSLIVSQAAISAATADRNEAWAVWHRLATRDRPPCDGVAHPLEPQWEEAARYSLDPERHRAMAADSALSALVECGRVAADSRLQSCFPYGLRTTLAHWIVFHWNRMGFSADVQRTLAAAMERVLRPGEADPADRT